MTGASPPRSAERISGFPPYAPATHRPPRAWVVIVGWIAVALCAGVVFEITCRVEDWVMYRMPVASPYESIEDLLVHDADGMHGRANARFEKWRMNDLGTRGPDAPVLPAAGTVRVIAVGASETFGLRESPDQEFPRQLEDTLNARLPRASCGGQAGVRRFEVLNAAFAGMTVPTIDQDIRNRLSRLHPAIILAYVSPSAYLEEDRPTAARPDSSPRHASFSRLRALHPRAIERLRDQFKNMLPQALLSLIRRGEINAANQGRSQDRRFTSVPPERLADLDADLRGLTGTIRSVGATPVLVTHANVFFGRATADSAKLLAWARFYPRATGAALVAFDSAARVTTLRVGADSDAIVSDAAAKLSTVPEAAFADYMHFTDLGAASMASIAADGVMSAAHVADCRDRQ